MKCNSESIHFCHSGHCALYLSRWQGSPPSCQQSTVLLCQIHKYFYTREADPVLERLPLSPTCLLSCWFSFNTSLIHWQVFAMSDKHEWHTTQQASEPLFQTQCWHSLVLPHLILPQTKHCVPQLASPHVILQRCLMSVSPSPLTADCREWQEVTLADRLTFLSRSRAETSQKVSVMH